MIQTIKNKHVQRDPSNQTKNTPSAIKMIKKHAQTKHVQRDNQTTNAPSATITKTRPTRRSNKNTSNQTINKTKTPRQSSKTNTPNTIQTIKKNAQRDLSNQNKTSGAIQAIKTKHVQRDPCNQKRKASSTIQTITITFHRFNQQLATKTKMNCSKHVTAHPTMCHENESNRGAHAHAFERDMR